MRASLAAFKEPRRADLSQIYTHVLVLSAEDERTVSVSAQRSVAERLRGTTFVTLPGKHDLLLNEPRVAEHLFGVEDFLAEHA